MRSISTRTLTGTVLENRRKSLATLASFIRLMRRNVTVECSAELCGVTHKMAFEWRHRVLATVSGHRDRIALRDTVWVDEANVNDTDLSKGYGQARKRGLSRQKLCTRVAIDIHKNPVAVVCGYGKPSSARVEKAMGGRIAPESLLVHDLERMETANDLCSWLKRFLWRFTGISPGIWRPTSTGASTSSGSTRPGTDGTRPKGWCAIS